MGMVAVVIGLLLFAQVLLVNRDRHKYSVTDRS